MDDAKNIGNAARAGAAAAPAVAPAAAPPAVPTAATPSAPSAVGSAAEPPCAPPLADDARHARREAAAAARRARSEQAARELRARDEAYMRLALEQARRAASLGEVPIGAVVVYEPIDPATRRPLAAPEVVARACNLRETTRDPAGHAEFLAMKQAAAALDAWRLCGCTVYVTLEPCIMCAGLMHQARIDRCVFGAPDPKAGALGTLYSINADTRLNHTFEATSGVLEEECAELLRGFFAARRTGRTAGRTATGARDEERS